MNTPTEHPLFSIVVPIWHPSLSKLRNCIGSVRAQTFTNWELIVVGDGPHPGEVLAELDWADPRIRHAITDHQLGPIEASNHGLALAKGDFIGFLGSGDTLAPFALEACQEPLHSFDDIDMIYTDEDSLDHNRNRHSPVFKPSWSPERLWAQMYIGQLALYSRSLIKDIGGLDPNFEGAHHYDLSLRAAEKVRRVAHIPRVCCHRDDTPGSPSERTSISPRTEQAGLRSVQAHLDRLGVDAEATPFPNQPGITHISPRRSSVAASIIIPTSGTIKFVDGDPVHLPDDAIRSILAHRGDNDVEIVVILDSSATADCAERIKSLDSERIVVVQDQEPFNFSRASNMGATVSTNDFLVFLNDDTSVLDPTWLARLELYANLPGVGAVGAKLLYGDGRLQHVGLVGSYGQILHQHIGFPGSHTGDQMETIIPRNVLAVTGACLAISKEIFVEVGGFPVSLPLAFNDVDLCIKLREAQYRVVVDNQTQLTHHESTTRCPVASEQEAAYLAGTISDIVTNDPYNNPNFTTSGPEQTPPAQAIVVGMEMIGSTQFPFRVSTPYASGAPKCNELDRYYWPVAHTSA